MPALVCTCLKLREGTVDALSGGSITSGELKWALRSCATLLRKQRSMRRCHRHLSLSDEDAGLWGREGGVGGGVRRWYLAFIAQAGSRQSGGSDPTAAAVLPERALDI